MIKYEETIEVRSGTPTNSTIDKVHTTNMYGGVSLDIIIIDELSEQPKNTPWYHQHKKSKY